MKLNLKSARKTSGSDGKDATLARPKEPRDAVGPDLQRGCPPAPGSDWFAFLDWASGGAFDPLPQDVDLAWRYWTGNTGNDESSEAAPGI